MAESLTVANIALAHLGSTLITALAGTEKEARYCNLRITQVRRALLRAHPWNFASRRYTFTATYGVITGAADNGAGLIRVTHVTHGFTTGDYVRIDQVLGTVEANATWQITVINANTYDLIGSAFVTAYASGGRDIKVPAFEWAYQFTLPTDFLRMRSFNETLDPDQYEIEGTKLLTDDDTCDVKYVSDISDDTLMDALFLEAFGLALATSLVTVITQSETMRQQLAQELKIAIAKARNVDAQENPGGALVANDWVDSRLDFTGGFVRDPMTS